MIGTKIETLYVEWRADYAKMKEDLRQIKEEMTRTKNEAQETARKTKTVGESAHASTSGLAAFAKGLAQAAASAAALRQVLMYTKDAILMAMDVHESESLFETSLGNMADSTRVWSEELATNLGLSADILRKNVGLWFTMTKSMGLSSEQALTMSKNLVQLKNDLMSFYNINDERAETIIKGMISGETEPAKQIGVLLTEEQAKRALVTAGIIEEGQAVDSTTLMYGRYLSMMQQTSTAHGDMARTIDSPANQLRVLQTQLREMQLAWGEAFIPIAQFVIPLLTGLAKALGSVAKAFGGFIGLLTGRKETVRLGVGIQRNIQDTATATDVGGVSWDDYGKKASKATGAAKQGVEALKASILGFDQLNVLNDPNSPGSGAGALAPEAIVPGGGLSGLEIPDFELPVEELDQQQADFFQVAGKIKKKIADWLENNPIAKFLAKISELGLMTNPLYLAYKAWSTIGELASPAIPEYKFVPDDLAESTKAKLEPFLKVWYDTEASIKQWAWGNVAITKEMAEGMALAVNDMGVKVSTAIDEQTESSYAAMLEFFSDSTALEDERERQILESIMQGGADRKNEINQYTSQINEIYSRAANENRSITESEKIEILRLMNEIKFKGIEAIATSASEQEKILKHLQLASSDISARQAADIVKNSHEAKKVAIDSAIEQADKIIYNAKRLYEAGSITKSEYDKIVKSAENARDDSIKAAETTHKKIVEEAKKQAGAHVNAVDWETGEIKSKWQMLLAAFWEFGRKYKEKMDEISQSILTFLSNFGKNIGDFFSGIGRSISSWWNESIAPWFSFSKWKGIVNDAIAGLTTGWNTFKSGFANFFKLPEIRLPRIKMPHISFSWDYNSWGASVAQKLGLPGIPRMNVQWYAKGGFPDLGELFVARESGPEMVGRMGSKTAVVNNEQIVAGIEAGVYNAVRAAMSGDGGGSGTIVVPVYIGGNKIYEEVIEAGKRRRMRSGFAPI